MTKHLACLFLLACTPFASAYPDWLDVTVKLHPSELYKRDVVMSEMEIPMDITIKNNSKFRAVMALTDMNLVVTGQIFTKAHRLFKWEYYIRKMRLPYLENHVIRFKTREVEIMPGENYKRTLYIRGSRFSPELARFKSVQMHPSTKSYRLNFEVETMVMKDSKSPRPRSRRD